MGIMSWCGGSQGYVEEKRSASGWTHTWRLWRHCCCRYGWYPLVVAPLATAGCLFSIYSSAGCDFIRVNVGFTPSNDAWNQSEAEFGVFMYQSGALDDNKYRSALIDGCRWYEDQFSDEFIDDDQTWKVTKLMAYISAISSALATITAWLFVISPLPAFFFWPGFLLPTLMTAFLTEGSKFLIFDTAVCRNTAWFPSGADSLPRVAEECTLGNTGAYAIASVSTFFVCLILVCLKAPAKRELEPHYGTDYEDSEFDAGRRFGNPEPNYYRGNPETFGNGQQIHDISPQDVPQLIVRDDGRKLQFTPNSKSSYDPEDSRLDFMEDFEEEEADDLVSVRLKTLDPSKDIYPSKHQWDQDGMGLGDRYTPSKSSPRDMIPDRSTVSESRLHTHEKMKRNSETESTELIEKFVNELNVCFEMDKTDDRGQIEL